MNRRLAFLLVVLIIAFGLSGCTDNEEVFSETSLNKYVRVNIGGFIDKAWIGLPDVYFLVEVDNEIIQLPGDDLFWEDVYPQGKWKMIDDCFYDFPIYDGVLSNLKIKMMDYDPLNSDDYMAGETFFFFPSSLPEERNVQATEAGFIYSLETVMY